MKDEEGKATVPTGERFIYPSKRLDWDYAAAEDCS
jgi:hypothetical protein